ncbi:hypothetical protein BD410DRAFT_826665 [Rickenella mellea]|uniref:ZZ-type domain-containing protein n=1 Tax=Rickenella mellea TaxID=50990 RepID=A0A4Y7QEY4_9AGAM|nr:hypothetical protein BD410DRAFT_826665 [Rickenella mellea]
MSGDREALKLLSVQNGVDGVSKRADNIHDEIATASSKITQVVATAKKAMAGVSMNDVMSMTPRECLIPLKRVMDALNAVKGVHPFIGPVPDCESDHDFWAVAVTAFEVLLTLEMKRRENDKRVSGILLKQADMMMALLQLDNIRDEDTKNEKGETVAGRLQTLIAEIRKDVEACGNVIDTYYKQKFLAKFLRANSWEDKFIGFASTFDKRKEDIKFALEIHVTIKLDTVADQVTNIDVKMDMLIQLFKDQTPREKHSPQKLSDSVVEVLLAQLDEASGGKPSTSLLVSVRTPLETLVDDNRAYFNVKMEAQMRQIDNAIQKSTRTIIRAIGDGPWKRVQDPNIRQVWKDMNAHSSVKARYFVLALHDHYLDQYENMNTFAGMHLDRDIAPPSPTLSHAETEAPNADGDTAFLQDSPAEADKWCLQYLSIQNISPLAEAIDDDVSGFIKIAEVNNFSNDKPEGFSMLRWVTFWAAGSAVEASMYHLRIEQLMEKLLDIVVMPENRSPYADYKFWLMWIRWLLRSRSHTTTEHPELIDLIRRHMTLQEKSITDSLEPAKWEIDGTDTVSTLLGPGRIEKYLYPTLYLVLRYHYQVFSLGSRHVLDNRELEAAYRTLWSILDACSNRTTTLAAAFDQRRGVHDFKRFAGGLFNNWNTKNPFKQFSEHFESNASFTLPDGQYAMEDRVEDLPELSAEKLHYCILDTANQLDISEDQRAYIDLRRKQIVLGFSGKSLDDVETSKMAELERIHETDRLVCQEIAWREFTGGGYHSFFCNGCGMAPILGTHYQCIGCFIDVGKTDFDLCQNCVTCLPEKTSTDCSYHPSTHPMNRFPYASDSFLRGRLREKAVEIVKELEKTSNTAFTCKGPCGRADAHGVHLRCIHCEDFILCADCISAHEADEFNGHGPLHFFTRFSGEPLIFKPKKEEVSDKVRMANMEAVLGEVKEQLAKQASLIQSLSDALNRAVGDNGIIIKE